MMPDENTKAPAAAARPGRIFGPPAAGLFSTFALPPGITPCVRGDSLLKNLTAAEKFAGHPGGGRNFLRRDQLQLFSPPVFRPVKPFEVR
jgi:hypothetical protein